MVARYVCHRCDKTLTNEDRMNGRWVAEFPGRSAHGYAAHGRDARVGGFAVDVHQADGTLADATAVLGAGQPEILTQCPEQRTLRFGADLDRLAVQLERVLRRGRAFTPHEPSLPLSLCLRFLRLTSGGQSPCQVPHPRWR